MRVRFFLVIVLGIGVYIGLSSIPAFAANLYVDPAGLCAGRTPCFTTIQAAINAAAAGDTVLAGPGTYGENINFLGKAITVRGEQGPSVTTINGNASGSVVTFASGESSTSVLSDFTLTNGFPTAPNGGGGISIRSASPTISGNTIINNKACEGAGIEINFGSPIVQGNTISNNSQAGCVGGPGGGGIGMVGGSAAQILNNTISGNTTGADGGGIALFGAGTPTIRDNIITGNTAGATGGAISMFNFSNADIVQNLITGNHAFQGGGIAAGVPFGNRGPLLVNNTVANNVAQQGSGVFIDGFDDQTLVVNDIIIGSPGETPAYCGTFSFTHSVPLFRFNDVFNPDGTPPYAGNCTNQTGLNGNISADPSFVNPANGDYHLASGSPCLGAGDTSAPDLPATDLDGNPRVVSGAVDMGVYEFSLLSFSAFSGKVDISIASFSFEANSTFTLGRGGIINPLTQDVTFQLGGFKMKIPAGSFQLQRKGDFVFEGAINGVLVEAKISPLGRGSYSFKIEGAGASNLPSANPVPVTLTIGNNTGTVMVNAEFE